ncbi:hypothetical protein TNCV_650621 [Trichonephila clavipes]|nr:hypothetical protein TNCV_650621 [Trichonephila clavipes]
MSPDLNPIGNVWDVLRRSVAAQRPTPMTIDGLKRALESLIEPVRKIGLLRVPRQAYLYTGSYCLYIRVIVTICPLFLDVYASKIACLMKSAFIRREDLTSKLICLVLVRLAPV